MSVEGYQVAYTDAQHLFAFRSLVVLEIMRNSFSATVPLFHFLGMF